MKEMKVYVQVIDTITGGYQFEMIDEPVAKGLEVQNALRHLGIEYGNVNWNNIHFNESNVYVGNICETSKNVIVFYND